MRGKEKNPTQSSFVLSTINLFHIALKLNLLAVGFVFPRLCPTSPSPPPVHSCPSAGGSPYRSLVLLKLTVKVGFSLPLLFVWGSSSKKHLKT